MCTSLVLRHRMALSAYEEPVSSSSWVTLWGEVLHTELIYMVLADQLIRHTSSRGHYTQNFSARRIEKATTLETRKEADIWKKKESTLL